LAISLVELWLIIADIGIGFSWNGMMPILVHALSERGEFNFKAYDYTLLVSIQ
jgi:hypothetical protein